MIGVGISVWRFGWRRLEYRIITAPVVTFFAMALTVLAEEFLKWSWNSLAGGVGKTTAFVMQKPGAALAAVGSWFEVFLFFGVMILLFVFFVNGVRIIFGKLSEGDQAEVRRAAIWVGVAVLATRLFGRSRD